MRGQLKVGAKETTNDLNRQLVTYWFPDFQGHRSQAWVIRLYINQTRTLEQMELHSEKVMENRVKHRSISNGKQLLGHRTFYNRYRKPCLWIAEGGKSGTKKFRLGYYAHNNLVTKYQRNLDFVLTTTERYFNWASLLCAFMP